MMTELWKYTKETRHTEWGLGEQEENSIDIFYKNVETGTNLERQGVSRLQQVPLV